MDVKFDNDYHQVVELHLNENDLINEIPDLDFGRYMNLLMWFLKDIQFKKESIKYWVKDGWGNYKDPDEVRKIMRETAEVLNKL